MSDSVLVLNAGSSSLKYSLVDDIVNTIAITAIQAQGEVSPAAQSEVSA